MFRYSREKQRTATETSKALCCFQAHIYLLKALFRIRYLRKDDGNVKCAKNVGL